MDKNDILADLRAQFGVVNVLYAPQIAILLNKPSAGAVLEHIKRGGFPLPVLVVGGRPAVSIFAVVNWLAGDLNSPPKATENSESITKPKVSDSKRKARSNVAKAMAAIRVQRNFLAELDSEMEVLILEQQQAESLKLEKINDSLKQVSKSPQKSLANRRDIV